MKIFGYEIKKIKEKDKQIEDCRLAYQNYKNKTFYEDVFDYEVGGRSIPWKVCGRSGRWLLVGSDSTLAKGCIKTVNYNAVEEICDVNKHFCYRFIRPEKLITKYHLFPKSNRYRL